MGISLMPSFCDRYLYTTGNHMKLTQEFHESRQDAVSDVPRSASRGTRIRSQSGSILAGLMLLVLTSTANAQSSPVAQHAAQTAIEAANAVSGKPVIGGKDERPVIDSSALIEEMRLMRETIERLEARVNRLEAERQAVGAVPSDQARTTAIGGELETPSSPGGDGPIAPSAAEPAAATIGTANQANNAISQQGAPAPSDRAVPDFLRDTTINLAVDGYYDYNFNAPIGRVNLLRAYDVLSNAFSLNQADVIFERAPDVADGRRFGARLDLQFGQATDTLQGNPSNEPRPDIYRNIFQAYGTYVVPLGSGLTVDFGKWASSLGIEGNYTKDQMNYSRSFWFDFLPFYHMGVRANYQFNDKIAVNYWVVNGTEQTEPFNSFKDQLVGFVLKPQKTVTVTANYYLGQEHPDVVPVPNMGSVPMQPGLSFEPIRPAPDGRLHIFDSYVTWQATSKFSLALEADYVIQRLWRTTSPGRSSAPAHVDGGAIYARYQLTPKIAFAGRSEYLSDRGGMFTGVTQALRENTLTFDYNLVSGFLMRFEWRRDNANQRYFITDTQGVLSKSQTTATVGLVWWWGRKAGIW
jgi:TolA-binding protein